MVSISVRVESFGETATKHGLSDFYAPATFSILLVFQHIMANTLKIIE